MGRTVSGKELLAGQHEFEFNKNQRLLELLAQGKRLPKEGSKVISEKESLLSKTAHQARRLKLNAEFEKEFKRVAGKVANTAKIFEKVIGRQKQQEEVVAL